MTLTLTNIEPDDIILLRDGRHTPVWWVSQRLLVSTFSDLSELYLWKKARPEYTNAISLSKRNKDIMPDTSKAWRFSRYKGQFYYAYDRIPERYTNRMPPIEVLAELARKSVKSDRLKSLETTVKERINELEGKYRAHYRGYKMEYVQRLAVACAALETCISMAREYGTKSSEWYRDFGTILDRLKVPYLPCNWRRLKEKADQVLAGKAIHQIVDLPRIDNQNARKLDDTEIESWVMQMRGMPQNFTNAHIIRKIRQICELTGKRQPSESWLADLLAAPEAKFLTSAGRYGERGRLGHIYRDYTPVANAVFAGDAWQVDGTRVNFIPWKNAQGREEFLYMVVVRDVHSGAILGEYFGLTEDRWAYLNALRMAVNTAGHLPYSLMFDRFPGHNTDEWRLVEQRMGLIGVDVQYKHTAQGKAQLERWFETLQSVFFQESAYYYGEGIQSTHQAAHRSAEYIKAVRKMANGQGWGFDQAVREASRCIQAYNETPLNQYSRKHATVAHSPVQLWGISEKPHVKTLHDFDRVMLFGLMKRVSIRNNMIRTEIQRVEYLYAVNDYEVLKSNRSVLLAYFLDDPTQAWLFQDDPEMIVNPRPLCEVQTMGRVQVFGPNANCKALGKDAHRRKEIARQREGDLARIQAAGSEVSLLLAGLGRKDEAEEAESAMLVESISDPASGRILNRIESEPEIYPDIDGDIDLAAAERFNW